MQYYCPPVTEKELKHQNAVFLKEKEWQELINVMPILNWELKLKTPHQLYLYIVGFILPMFFKRNTLEKVISASIGEAMHQTMSNYSFRCIQGRYQSRVQLKSLLLSYLMWPKYEFMVIQLLTVILGKKMLHM